MVGLGEAWTRGNFSSFFCLHSIYDDYIIRLAWIVLWWQTKGSNHIIIVISISTSPFADDDEDDDGDYDDDNDDDDRNIYLQNKYL